MNNTNLIEVIAALRELETDSSVPKNVKAKIKNIVQNLQQKEESSIKISRALNELEEITEDTNMQAYTRTQIFGIVSSLEIIH